MGRWAQRRVRGGGGPPPGAALNFMTAAEILSFQQSTAIYSQPVDFTVFDLADFTSNPSGEVPEQIEQGAPESIILDFSLVGDISADTELAYAGDAPDVETPQTMAYT
jgi:hypothetical protein